ncbi:MAG: BamA/TamA family outer membrane protein [bacterium]
MHGTDRRFGLLVATWLAGLVAAMAFDSPYSAAAAPNGSSAAASADSTLTDSSARPSSALVLETLAIEGNTRTSREAVLRRFPLHEGDVVDPDKVLDAIDTLRAADLFAKVDFRAEAGSTRGQVKLVLVVLEKSVEVRFGTGYQDLDGWYLVPAELRFDNRLGQGERLRLTTKIGYRVGGAELSFAQPSAGSSGRLFWGVGIGAYGINRVYFVDGVEYAHHLGQGNVGAYAGRRFGKSWRAEVGARLETINADSSAKANQTDDVVGVRLGDELTFADLPAGVRDAVGKRKGSVLHAEIARDTRSTALVAGSPEHGFWGRVRAESFLREDVRANAVTADLRGYGRVADLGVALRLRAGVIGEDALFYDRFYLGGLYSVRGFPSQSLSPAGGDTRFWTASLELRGALAGAEDRPRLAGLVFLDAGQGWWPGGELVAPADTTFSPNATAFNPEKASVSAGFGLRLRVPWIEWVGLDFGIPLTDTPVRESFHANGALGWNF